MSDYLWDKSGEPDPEIGRLEGLLGRYGYQPTPPPAFPRRAARIVPIFTWRKPLAVAAALVLVAGGVWIATWRPREEWAVARVEGAPRVAARPITGDARLRAGEWLETDATSRVKLAVGLIGELEVEPSSRLRLIRTRLTEHRIVLERGTIQALIWAPARTFFVETPSAVAVDLGCKYVLTVDDAGAGLLRVIMGWVGFEHDGQESFIPENALCKTRPGIGLGTPYYEDAPTALRTALDQFDFFGRRAEPLAVVLAEARRRDALTLWHLLVRARVEDRGRVFDRMAELVPPPAGVTRGGLLAGDRRMHELWWDALGLENTSWWRKWKRLLPPVK